MRGFEEAQKDDKAADKGNDKQAGLPNLLDIHHEPQLRLSKSDLLQAAEPLAMPLNNYLVIRDAQENDQSYFKTGAAFVTRLGRRALGVEDASSKFDEARKQGNHGLMMSLEREDHEQRKFEHRIGAYSGAALKTAFLFSGGKIGLAGLAAVTTTDEARPADPFPKQATDALLGAAKGLATRFVFNQINEQSWNPVVKGWTLGMSNRFIDVGLTSNTYMNAAGDLDLKAGGLKTLSSVFSPQSLIVDAGAGLAAGLTLMPINAYTGGNFFKNVAAARLTMAGVSGMTEGSLQDLNKQQDNPRQPAIDWLEVAKKGLQKGTIDTISALPSSGLIKLK